MKDFFSSKRYMQFFPSNIFYLFLFITVLFEVGCTFIIYFISYNSYTAHLQTQLNTEASRIEGAIQEVFRETHQIMVYIGKQIASYSAQDPQFIEKILLSTTKFLPNVKIYPWSLFDWVDPNNLRVINSQIGRLKDGPIKVHDSYIWKCPKTPWTLQFSRPTLGNTSGMWAIPIGLGVTDTKNNYLGTLNVGINIAEFNAKIQQLLASKMISFVVLDEKFRIILQSADNSIDPKSSYYKDMLVGKDYFKEDKNYLSSPLSYKDISYSFFRKTQDYPYIILTGFNNPLIQKEFLAIFLPRLLELYGVGAFCLCLLYLLRKRIFRLRKASSIAKQDHYRHFSAEMKKPVEAILVYCNVIIKNLEEENCVILTKERKIELMEKIYEEALTLDLLLGENRPDFSSININHIIDNSISFLMDLALEKNISVRTSLDSPLLPFYGDELTLQQIIVGLIALSMEYSPKSSTLKISATNKISHDGKILLIIRIEDNGFNLDADDILRISEQFSKKRALESVLNFSSIEKLIQFYKGTCYICNKTQRGKIISVTLPYTSENEEEDEKSSPAAENVYWLFGKKS